MVGEKLTGLGVWTGKPGWKPVAVLNTPGARALPGSPSHPTGSAPCLRVKPNPGREVGFLASLRVWSGEQLSSVGSNRPSHSVKTLQMAASQLAWWQRAPGPSGAPAALSL